MTKEELVEMINSTINTNGSGAITGEALNLALQAIVETMGTGSGSGAEKLQGYFDGSAWVQTDEEKALNAQLYTKITTALANDQPISVWGVFNQGATKFNLVSVAIASAAEYTAIMFYVSSSVVETSITADGSVTIQVGG